MAMENEKPLFTQNVDVYCHLASIRQICRIMLDFLNLADSSMFITLYIANGMDNCVKQMLDDVESIKKQVDELNKEKE